LRDTIDGAIGDYLVWGGAIGDYLRDTIGDYSALLLNEFGRSFAA
jgi:hypothetical protein